jgi:hypothetical protein
VNDVHRKDPKVNKIKMNLRGIDRGDSDNLMAIF